MNEFLKSQSLTRLLVYRLQNFEIFNGTAFGMQGGCAVFEQGLYQMTNHFKYFNFKYFKLKSNTYICNIDREHVSSRACAE